MLQLAWENGADLYAQESPATWSCRAIPTGERWHSSGPAPSYRPPIDKGGQPVDDSHGHHLLTILAGPSRWQTYLTQAMANGVMMVPRNFFRVVTSPNQVPKHLRHLFRLRSDGSMVGGTIDRWTRTIYMVPAPVLRQETRLEYALHEAVHLFADPHAPSRGGVRGAMHRDLPTAVRRRLRRGPHPGDHRGHHECARH